MGVFQSPTLSALGGPAEKNVDPAKARRAPSTPDEDKLAKQICSEFRQLYGLRGVWEYHWQQIAEQMIPNHLYTFNALSIRTPGAKRMQYVFDSTAILALKRFTAIMDSILTPWGKRWHSIAPEDETLLRRRDVRLWCEKATDFLFSKRYAYTANYASQNLSTWTSLGGYGSGGLFIDKLDTMGGYYRPGMRYKNVHLGESYYRENHQGIVDCVYRYFQLTAWQAMQKWGARCPEPIQIAAEKFPEATYYFLHCSRPRAEWDPYRLDSKGFYIGSYYISMTGETLLEESGYRSFPYAIARYEQFTGEVYGRGPGMDVLPAVRMLNEMAKAHIKQGHRALDPVLLVHDDGVISGFSLKPGALNSGAVSPEGRPLIHALPTGDLAVGDKIMERQEKLINSAFLIDLFQILTEGPEMTATEVLERVKEKGLLLNPTFSRMQSEYCGPTIHRELDIALTEGWLEMPPRILIESGAYKVLYSAPINRDMQADEAAGMERAIQEAAQLSQLTQQPETMDNFDLDLAIPEIALIRGAKSRWMRSEDKIAQIRQQRAQSQQAQQMIQAAPGTAALMKASAVVNQGATGRNNVGRAPK